MAVVTSPPWPAVLLDRDPDAPDDSPSGPLLPLARWLLYISTSVNYCALKLWHSLLLLLRFTSSFVMRPLRCLQVQAQQIRSIITLLSIYLRAPKCNTQQQIDVCNNPSTLGHCWFLWNFQALKATRMIIISWIEIKATLRTNQVVWMCNVSKTFIQAFFYKTLQECSKRDSPMQQTSLLFLLNPELQDTILVRLPFNEIFRLRAVCKGFDNVMKSNTFKSLCKTSEGLFGPVVLYLENMTTHMIWQWISYDIISQQWRKMPPFPSILLPDEELFKDFLIAGSHGLMCIDVGKGNNEKLVLYQPLTGEMKVLPHLIRRRRPVLIHVIVNDLENTYIIIVAGSSTIGNKYLSQKTEVYDSCTSCWSESEDIPGPHFALNEYQTGVYVKNINTLFCIGFLPNNKGRGILAYNVAKKMWIQDAFFQLPDNFDFSETRVPTQITIAQLMEYGDDVYLFSEQEAGPEVIHSIHKLLRLKEIGIMNDHENRIMNDHENDFDNITTSWERVLCESRNGTCGLLVYPEFVCLAHGKNQFCIFNTIEHSGTLYTIRPENGINTTSRKKLPPFPKLKENSLTFHSLNSLGFAFELSFKISL